MEGDGRLAELTLGSGLQSGCGLDRGLVTGTRSSLDGLISGGGGGGGGGAATGKGGFNSTREKVKWREISEISVAGRLPRVGMCSGSLN
ncbi:hypothetical protein FHL15_000288 [Xylaria flabelliformis]|uniref:Uncharacterized protein n=1 Tax=Xylaria flabelliformis TaxID=2512241 RepID=A0A553IFG3_9PEZI|nr:hypothetical protein FHL15_000288 [Xylaria flabelliformis]